MKKWIILCLLCLTIALPCLCITACAQTPKKVAGIYWAYEYESNGEKNEFYIEEPYYYKLNSDGTGERKVYDFFMEYYKTYPITYKLDKYKITIITDGNENSAQVGGIRNGVINIDDHLYCKEGIYKPIKNYNNIYYCTGTDGNYTAFAVANRDITSAKIKSRADNVKVTSISPAAFYVCRDLKSISIPNSIKTIGHSAFSWCSSLTKIDIPDSVTDLGDHLFDSCDNLKEIKLGRNISKITKGTFYGCDNIETIKISGENKKYHSNGNCIIETDTKTLIAGFNNSQIPTDGSVTSIGNGAFELCLNLKNIIVPNKVTSIGDYAFYNCIRLESLTLHDNITHIGTHAFEHCESLREISLPNNLDSIEDFLLSGCINLKTVFIPNGITNIGERAFGGCYSLQEIYIPDSVTNIEKYAFNSCSNLREISIPNGVTSIKLQTFYACDSLEKITIPDSITVIEKYALSICKNLKDITYNGTVEQWNAIEKLDYWDYSTLNYTIHCTDGDIQKENNF